MPVSIDVVIPSYRLLKETLLPILKLQYPANVVINFFLVADNPSIIPDPEIQALVDNQKVFLIINSKNIGAAETRNTGINAGKGDWILFLDDDVVVSPDLLFVYADAIQQNPDEVGFIGLVDLPPSVNNYTDALLISGLVDGFVLAKKQSSAAWGPTANTMINRSKMGDIRFADVWGGEDVDFFIRVREQNDYRNYLCLPQAKVIHLWWRNGKPELSRFWGYGKGNSTLTQRNPKYTSYDFLNTPETLFVSGIIFLIVFFADHQHAYLAAWFILLTLALEYFISAVRVIKSQVKFSLITAFYVMLLRNSIDAGVLFGNISRLRLSGIGERFHFSGQLKHSHFVLNTYKIIKLSVYLIAIVYILTRVL